MAQLAPYLSKTFPIYSPSDVGIHNSLLLEGRVTFLDFEYAGMDSPIKLILDYISNPQNNQSEVPLTFLRSLLNEDLGFTSSNFLSLLDKLRMYYSTKWSLICLAIINKNPTDEVAQLNLLKSMDGIEGIYA